jgi:hypothetical protein
VGCALGWLEFRFPEIAWRTEYPNLGKLMDKLMQRLEGGIGRVAIVQTRQAVRGEGLEPADNVVRCGARVGERHGWLQSGEAADGRKVQPVG